MTRAVLPNPSARAEWLFAGVIDRALNHWGHVPPLDGGMGDNDHADSETDTAIPDDDDQDIASLASQPPVSVQPSSLQLCPPFPEGQFASVFLMFPGDLVLDTLFEDNGVSCMNIEDLLTLERAVYQQCTPGQLPLSDRQRFNTQKCVRFLQDLVAAAVLRHTVQVSPFSSWTSPMRAWCERRHNGIHIFDVLPLAAAVYIIIKPVPRRTQIPRHTRPLADLLAAIAGLLAWRQLHNAPSLHTAWTIQQITRAEFHILEVLNYELATPTPAAWIEIFERRLSLWEDHQLQLPHHPHIPAAPPVVSAGGAHLIGASAWFISVAFLGLSGTGCGTSVTSQSLIALSAMTHNSISSHNFVHVDFTPFALEVCLTFLFTRKF